MGREAKEFEDNIKGLNEKVNEMQQHLNDEEAKTGKMKEEMEVEVKLYHDKQDRLTKRVETLDADLEEAKLRKEGATSDLEAKSEEIEALKKKVEETLQESQRIQEKQTQQENVGAVQGREA